jgi:hypothetical protein
MTTFDESIPLEYEISNATTSEFPVHFILDSVRRGLDSLMLELKGNQFTSLWTRSLGSLRSLNIRLALKGRDG